MGSLIIPVSSAFDSFIGISTFEPITEITIEDIDPNAGILQGVLNVRFGTRDFGASVPTLSEWGMIAAAAGLGLIGVFFAVKRRRMQAGVR